MQLPYNMIFLRVNVVTYVGNILVIGIIVRNTVLRLYTLKFILTSVQPECSFIPASLTFVLIK